ncbi:uncharacterized protein LOC118449202 [Vespa mandarinia]|uniref:uncharacterized protein LOC118449202 n=1 Tax=Vespa mandarinia TaxID=7446 RepID=UPI001614A9D0|nr:uncharacterized protein LOC118449202 [Vespa mandarinia]
MARQSEINRVSARIPQFWMEEPLVWFTLAEIQFNLAGVTQDNIKYAHVLSKLDEKYIHVMLDVIMNPPATKRYENFKEQVIKRFTNASNIKRLQLLEKEELGDRIPSEFLRHLRNLAESRLSQGLLYIIWTSKLPAHIQTIVKTMHDSPLNIRAEVADRIADLSLPYNMPTKAAEIKIKDINNEDVISLKHQINGLTETVKEVYLNEKQRKLEFYGAKNEQSRKYQLDNQEQEHQNNMNLKEICYFHRKFGNEAGKCILPCSFRHLNYTSQVTVDAQHITGKNNIIVDTLSEVSGIATTINYKELAQAQEHDSEFQQFRQRKTAFLIKKMYIRDFNAEVYCDISTGQPKPFLTKSYRKSAFNSIHNLSHTGMKATIKLLRQKYVWPTIKKDVKQWIKECIVCRNSKIIRHVKSSEYFITPSQKFEDVHIDIVGPLPISNGYKYCLTCVDRFTHWPEVVPLRNTSMENIAQAFLEGWIYRFGVPLRITTDYDKQFEYYLFKAFSKFLRITHLWTTAYHPEANSLIKRLLKQLETIIKCNGNKNWTEVLPTAMLTIRSVIKEDIQATTAELVYGETIRFPEELLIKGAKDSMLEFLKQNLTMATDTFLYHNATMKPLQPYDETSKERETSRERKIFYH